EHYEQGEDAVGDGGAGVVFESGPPANRRGEGEGVLPRGRAGAVHPGTDGAGGVAGSSGARQSRLWRGRADESHQSTRSRTATHLHRPPARPYGPMPDVSQEWPDQEPRRLAGEKSWMARAGN